MCRRINGVSRGLLEIRSNHVEFLHRTVRDFFHTIDMTDYLNSLIESGYGPALGISKAYLALIKTSRYGDGIDKGLARNMLGQNREPLVVHLHEALTYVLWAAEANECTHEDAVCLLDEYERAIECSITKSQTITDGVSTTMRGCHSERR